MKLPTSMQWLLAGLTATSAIAQSSSSTPSSTASSPLALYTISAGNITAVFTSYGARLTSLLVPDRNGTAQDIVVGYDTGAQYVTDSATNHTFFGAVVGRYANRIKNGTFSLDGQTYHIPINENGVSTLHGGTIGYDQRNWTVMTQNDDSISFSLLDDNFEGFPGKVLTTAAFAVSNVAGGPYDTMRPQLTTRLVSIALDEPTPIMLSNHIYWNLSASKAKTILNDTTFWMPYSKRYIEVDPILIPTGGFGVVSDVPALDFTSPKLLGTAISNATGLCGSGCTGIDNAFILDRPAYTSDDDAGFPVVSLWSEITGIKMDVITNMQGMQVYSCNGQNGTIPIKASQAQRNGGSGAQYVEKYGCLVLEPQVYIDGINHPEWGVDKYEIFSPTTGPSVNVASYQFSVL